MEDEVIIIEAKAKIVEVNCKMSEITTEPRQFAYRESYLKELYEVNQPITRRPQYLAIRDPGDIRVELLLKIDQLRSVFEKGYLVPQGEPRHVQIYLRAKNNFSTNHSIWYTSLQKLLTHDSTDEFIKEKSKPFTQLTAQDYKILCNGYSCNHITYCKFFNQSPSPTIKSQIKRKTHD